MQKNTRHTGNSILIEAVSKKQGFTRRIGTTTFEVSVYFSKTSKETIDDKILRLIRNEVANGKAAGQ